MCYCRNIDIFSVRGDWFKNNFILPFNPGKIIKRLFIWIELFREFLSDIK